MIDVNTAWGMIHLVTPRPLPPGIVRKLAVAPGGEELRQWLCVLGNGVREQLVYSEGLLSRGKEVCCGGTARRGLTEVGGAVILKRMRECAHVCTCVRAYVRTHNLLYPCFAFSRIMPTGTCLHAQAKALMFYVSLTVFQMLAQLCRNLPGTGIFLTSQRWFG